MKKIYFPSLLLCFFLLLQKQSSAQDNNTDEKSSKTSYVNFGLNYLSNNVYLGRKDSVKTPYLTPSIGYYHKSGLFVNASASYLTTENRIDLVTLSGGYSFNINKLDGELTADKYFYSSKSYSVKSAITADAMAYLGYDLNFIKPTITGLLNFGNKTDYGVMLGLEHTFITADDNWDITPSVFMNAGTQNYYDLYYKQRRYAKNRKGKKIAYDITATSLDASKFKTLDYELTVPVNYLVNQFTFNFTPTFAIPVNPNIISTTTKPANASGPVGTKTSTENLSNTLFWTIGITYKLKK